MTKQEKIQRAYGEHWEENVREDDGFLKYGSRQSDKENDFWERKEWLGYFFYRPKSLQGIETNNGWIKIESEADLPKENIECFYILEIPEKYSNNGTKINIGSFRFGKDLMSGQSNYFTIDNFFYHRFPSVTHYQPIIKPQLPIY